MISHFWNLCRACPAVDIDKVGQDLLAIATEVSRKSFSRVVIIQRSCCDN